MPGLACVHLMLPQSLGQKILEWDEKEAINCERDLQKVGELAKAEDAKNPEIKSVQYPGREQQASCVAMRFAPLVFMDVERPVAHVAVSEQRSHALQFLCHHGPRKSPHR